MQPGADSAKDIRTETVTCCPRGRVWIEWLDKARPDEGVKRGFVMDLGDRHTMDDRDSCYENVSYCPWCGKRLPEKPAC